MKKFFGALLAAAAPAVTAVVQPDALINFAFGAVAKHAIKKLPNNLIPYLNVGIGSAICIAKHGISTGDWASSVLPGIKEGCQLAAGSTLLHQTMKIPMRSVWVSSL